ncbi:MAG: EamA family transporter RarD [Eubacteriales bacterium]|jgi:chloramphenicol-sensitive protein RarD|nr:EamA family transporter RarD [Eubacteriales bacterium]
MKERNIGLLSALACYILWGLLPLYWRLLEEMDAVFILANRIIWSAVFTAGILLITKKTKDVKAVIRDKKKMRYMIPAAIIITINWGVYIWAVNAGHLLDSSLGYYMNPLVVFAIGIALFHETSGVIDWIALGLATIGVLIATIAYGAFPWIAVVLALSFGLYGTLKKLAGVGGLASIAVETLLIAPFALAFLVLAPASHASLAKLTPLTTVLLLLTGVVTASPLILFTVGINRLPLTTVGFLQYSSPTLQMLIGVLVFKEVLTQDRIIAFAFIAAALVLYTIGMTQRARKARLKA